MGVGVRARVRARVVPCATGVAGAPPRCHTPAAPYASPPCPWPPWVRVRCRVRVGVSVRVKGWCKG